MWAKSVRFYFFPMRRTRIGNDCSVVSEYGEKMLKQHWWAHTGVLK